MARKANPNPLMVTLYTPEVEALIDAIIEEHGFWEACHLTDTPYRSMRYLQYGHSSNGRYLNYVTKPVMERLINGSGIGNIDDFPWIKRGSVLRVNKEKRPYKPPRQRHRP